MNSRNPVTCICFVDHSLSGTCSLPASSLGIRGIRYKDRVTPLLIHLCVSVCVCVCVCVYVCMCVCVCVCVCARKRERQNIARLLAQFCDKVCCQKCLVEVNKYFMWCDLNGAVVSTCWDKLKQDHDGE